MGQPLALLDVTRGLEGHLEGDVPWDVAVNINMMHIAPPECSEGLFQVCSKALRPGGFLLTYGPYCVDGFMVPSNKEFDRRLKQMDPRFGIRELRDLERLAAGYGFTLEAAHDMPANN